MRRLWWAIKRIWWRIAGVRVSGKVAFKGPVFAQQPVQGKRRERGMRWAIRKAVVKSRSPKPKKERERDIDAERLAKIKARRKK